MSKFLTLVGLCLLAAALCRAEYKAEMVEKLVAKAESCLAETGATKSDIDDMLAKKPSAGHEGKCLRACIMKKFDVMDDNGKFVKAVALSHVDKLAEGDAEKAKAITELIEFCAAIEVPDDKCEAAELYKNCGKEQAIARGLTKSGI